MRSCTLGIDVGTSSVKCVLIDEQGGVLAVQSESYAFLSPKPLWAETDPSVWWNALLKALKKLWARDAINPSALEAVGLTGQMHGLVLLDAQGKVLRPCMMWNDQRAFEECRLVEKTLGKANVLKSAGSALLPGFTAPKLAWVRTHEPEVYAATKHILLPKDYIRYCLGDFLGTDVSDASGTGLLDVGRRVWSQEMLDAFDVKSSLLPELAESPDVTSTVSAEASALTSLPQGLPIVAGAGDQAACGVGVGVVEPGTASISLGTSGVVFSYSDTYRVEPGGRLHAFCHAVPGKWHLMGVMLSAAGSYAWLSQLLEKDFKTMDALAATISPGAEGLFFLPYLAGERTPHNDPMAKGAFVGMTVRHQVAHLVRAVLEGVCFGLRDAIELMHALDVFPSRYVLSGGGAQSPLWSSILASVLRETLYPLAISEGAAYGAALLASVGAGVHATVAEASEAALSLKSDVDPQSSDSEHYRNLYDLYRSLYPDLKSFFQDLGKA